MNMVKQKEEVVAAEVITFTKEKILQMKKYTDRIDLLNVLLEKDKVYTLENVDALIDKFMKGKVN